MFHYSISLPVWFVILVSPGRTWIQGSDFVLLYFNGPTGDWIPDLFCWVSSVPHLFLMVSDIIFVVWIWSFFQEAHILASGSSHWNEIVSWGLWPNEWSTPWVESFQWYFGKLVGIRKWGLVGKGRSLRKSDLQGYVLSLAPSNISLCFLAATRWNVSSATRTH